MLIDSSQRTHSLMLILAHPVVILILITPVQSSFYVHSSYFLMSPLIFHGTIFPLCVFSVLKLIKQIQICICSLCLLQTTPFLIMQGSLWCTMQSYLEIFLPVLYRYQGAYTRCQQLSTNQMTLPLISYLGL